MTTARTCGALTAALFAAAVGGSAAQQHIPLTDAQIGAQVEHRLVEEGIRGVTVAVSQRTVTLSGTVASVWARDEAIDEARKADDVVGVVNALTILRAESDEVLGEAVTTKAEPAA